MAQSVERYIHRCSQVVFDAGLATVARWDFRKLASITTLADSAFLIFSRCLIKKLNHPAVEEWLEGQKNTFVTKFTHLADEVIATKLFPLLKSKTFPPRHRT